MAFLFLQAVEHWKSHESENTGDLHSTRNYQHVPFFASPLNPKAQAWLQTKKHRSPREKGQPRRVNTTLADFESDHADSKLARSIFRKQHEASSLELFFDLFFVGSLASFTAQHAHVDLSSVGNYIGFFFILWTTWYHICVYDVRFYVDCVWNRWWKLFSFAIMTTFAGLSPVYDAVTYGGGTRAFQGIALVLMASRFMFIAQYLVVLWYVRHFKKTLVPFLLLIFIYLATAMAFLGTRLEHFSMYIDGSDGTSHVNAWYAIMAVELVATTVVSSIWRILSFKHTHMVERVGLLTLIIIGEGIIGFLKAIYYMLMGTDIGVWGRLGSLWSSVMLLYVIYILYFDNIAHDRFGTIRQQIWVILHLPLHIAILLTVEGNTALTIWDACMSARETIIDLLPSFGRPSTGYADLTDYITSLNETYNSVAERYHYLELSSYYVIQPDLDKTIAINATFGSPEWNRQVRPILNDTFSYFQYYIFQNYYAEASKKAETEPDPYLKVLYYFNAFKTSFIYFYIAAGVMLICLGLMFWFGKNRKNRYEYFGISARLIVGTGIPFLSFLAWNEQGNEGFRFSESGWIIPICLFCLLGVCMADNYIKKFAFWRERRSNKQVALENGSTYNEVRDQDANAEVDGEESEETLKASRTLSPDGLKDERTRSESRQQDSIVQAESRLSQPFVESAPTRTSEGSTRSFHGPFTFEPQTSSARTG